VSWLIGLAMATISSAASDSIPLKQGLFVDRREHCGGGHGYLYYEFDGSNISFGAPPIKAKLKRVTSIEYVLTYRDESGNITRENLIIKSPIQFVLADRYGTYKIKYCPRSSLPRAWRNSERSN
jgi:hypothetical protein